MQVSIALVGIGGYGEAYLNALLPVETDKGIRLAAAIDPQPERCMRVNDLREAGVPIYSNLDQFYQQDTADLVVISTPINYHAPLTSLALANGSNVLCEKPLAGSLADARLMLDAEQLAGKFVAIGYQWSFSKAVQELKRDILAGIFGKPLHFKSAVLWPRRKSYYQRSNWAGKIQTSSGAWVIDSPVHNATAHYLHNMLYLLGDQIEKSVQPTALEAELYRANPIENYDTAALHVATRDSADLLFLTTHAVDDQCGPLIYYEFEEAVVEYPGEAYQFQARFHNGTIKNYGSPDTDVSNKLWQSVEAVRSGQPVVCGIRAALPELLCAEAAQQAPIYGFPEHLIRIQDADGDPLTYVEGLYDTLLDCFQTNRLPSENPAIPWANNKSSIPLVANL
jgi:predicted dehydrogenase